MLIKNDENHNLDTSIKGNLRKVKSCPSIIEYSKYDHTKINKIMLDDIIDKLPFKHKYLIFF